MAAARPTVASEADLEYLRTIDTGFVHDALMLLGLNGSTARLSPVSPFGEKHVAGPVATVKFVPSNGIDKPLAHAYEVMNRAGKGTIIVIDCQGYPGNFLGGNMARIGSRVGLGTGGRRHRRRFQGYAGGPGPRTSCIHDTGRLCCRWRRLRTEVLSDVVVREGCTGHMRRRSGEPR